MASENRMLSDEKRNLETRLNHTESELNVCDMTKEHLRNDKTIVSIVSGAFKGGHKGPIPPGATI